MDQLFSDIAGLERYKLFGGYYLQLGDLFIFALLLVTILLTAIVVLLIKHNVDYHYYHKLEEENCRLHYEIIQLKATEAVRKEQAASNQRNE